jgi:putative membrane protein
MMDGGWAGGGSWLWMLGGLLLVIGAVILVAWMVTRSSRSGDRPAQDASRPTPSQILGERFARGEMTDQEFEQSKKALNPDR